MDGRCYRAELMEMCPERNSCVSSSLLALGRPPVLLGLSCLILSVVTLASIPLVPSGDDLRPAQGMETSSLDKEPPAAAAPPFSSGGGRPLASGEIGTVLSILFKEEPTAPETLKGAPRASQPASTAPVGVPPDAEQIRSIQSRLSALGYPSGDENGVWGPRSRQALREFKTTRQLPLDDAWDEATERALFSEPASRKTDAFAGVWAPDAKACSPQTNRKGLLPAVINHEGAWAGNVSCSFKNGRREGEGWRFAAACSGPRKRWTASVKMTVDGDVLTWSSERGSQRYVRCSSLT